MKLRTVVLEVIRITEVDTTKGKFLLALVMLTSLAHLIFIPITFECDALTYLNNAKAFMGAAHPLDDYRPPLYPFILILTGVVFPGSVILLVALQWLIGVASVYIFHRSLKTFGFRPEVYLASATFAASGIPFAYAKFILAEQFFIFFFLLSIYFFCNFYKSKKVEFFYKFYLFGLLATLTRWDGMFLVLGGTFFILAINRNDRIYRAVFATLLMSVFLFFSYSGLRVLYKRDISIFGTIQNGTDRQLFWRLYTIRPPNLEIENDIPPTPKSIVNISNGPNTRLLASIILNHIKDHPESVEMQRSSLDQIPSPQTGETTGGIFNELYGRFNKDPERIVENMFNASLYDNHSTDYYSFLIIQTVVNEFGIVRGEQLLRKVNVEAIFASSTFSRLALADALSYLGIGLKGIKAISSGQLELSDIFPFWGKYHLISSEFNIAGCARNGMNTHLWTEYTLDRSVYDGIPKEILNNFQNFSSWGRNVVRTLFGLLFLIGLTTILLRGRRSVVCVFFYGITSFLIIFYGTIAGGAYQRYEVTTLPLIIISSFVALFSKSYSSKL